jgi:tetratricopeptide (TPR) repeat protein
MSGHETAAEAALVKQMEAEIDPATSPTARVVELGQLYIEPCHREDRAIALFETVLGREPDNLAARYWLAYCLVHQRMDEASLRQSVEMLQGVVSASGSYAAAAGMLLAEALEELGELAQDEKIRLLEASVEREPGWVYNRQSLGWAYAEAGRLADARQQYDHALANVATPDPEWTSVKRHFEEAITGRIGHRVCERLQSDLDKVS